MDENSTKINVFKDALDNQKQKWNLWQQRPKDQKDNFQESVNQQLSKARKVDGHKNVVLTRKHKRSPKQDLTQRLRSTFLPWQNRAPKTPNNKYCVLNKNDDACNKTNKTNTFQNQREFEIRYLM